MQSTIIKCWDKIMNLSILASSYSIYFGMTLIHENDTLEQLFKIPSDIPLYLLVNRDPYDGYHNPNITG